MKQRRKITNKSRIKNLIWTIGVTEGVSLYAGLHLGNCFLSLPEGQGRNILNAVMLMSAHLTEHPFLVFPSDPLMVGICLVSGSLGSLYFYNEYLKVKDVVDDAYGDAAFEEDYRRYDREYVFEPEMTLYLTKHRELLQTDSTPVVKDGCVTRSELQLKAPYNEDYKRVLWKYPDRRVAKRMRLEAQIYSMHVALSLNGKWSNRNSNALIFGASGTGKSRYFLLPNILQANSSLFMTDPSADVMQKAGGFLKDKRGYLLKCFSTVDMEHSCRFNPLFYIRDEEDIIMSVTTLLDNTSGWKKRCDGDMNFWTMSTQALLCCVIGYLWEVVPIEQRNFANVMEILRMDDRNEGSDPAAETAFDELFRKLGKANPNSYAYNQYLTYKKAPLKTALNIMISTTVMLSEYIDIAAFRDLTMKDEMELDRLGCERMAIFLNIPEGRNPYAWISAMMFTITFNLLKKQGQERMKRLGLGDPELLMPVRFLLDECRNIGRIPDLEGALSYCRKYRISIVPIFQSFSQIKNIYGNHEANEFLANCDTMMFLGGRDPETLEVVCNEMGKYTAKELDYSNPRGGRGSASMSTRSVGKELMSKIDASQMSNRECLVFIRGLRPFKDEKYRLNRHPNYRYLPEGGHGKPMVNPFRIIHDDEEMERCRIKAPDEDGYIAPKVVDSARRRAMIARSQKKATIPEGTKIKSIKFTGSFAPDFEFDHPGEETLKRLLK